MNYDKPLIAAVNGAAAGGGFALAMLHDIRLASERATFTSAFVRIGLVAEMGLCYTLPRAIGLEAAMDVMYTGRSVNADEARAMGLVGRVVPHERLTDEAMAYAEQIAAQAPIAVQFAKRALARSLDNALARPTRAGVVLPGRRLRHRRCTRGHRRLPRAVGRLTVRWQLSRRDSSSVIFGGTAQFVALVVDRDLEIHQVSRRQSPALSTPLVDHAAAADHRVACVDRAQQRDLAPHHPAVRAGRSRSRSCRRSRRDAWC